MAPTRWSRSTRRRTATLTRLSRCTTWSRPRCTRAPTTSGTDASGGGRRTRRLPLRLEPRFGGALFFASALFCVGPGRRRRPGGGGAQLVEEQHVGNAVDLQPLGALVVADRLGGAVADEPVRRPGIVAGGGEPPLDLADDRGRCPRSGRAVGQGEDEPRRPDRRRCGPGSGKSRGKARGEARR